VGQLIASVREQPIANGICHYGSLFFLLLFLCSLKSQPANSEWEMNFIDWKFVVDSLVSRLN